MYVSVYTGAVNVVLKKEAANIEHQTVKLETSST